MDIRGICVLKIFGSVGGELLYVQQASCKINDHRTLIMTWLESRCAKMENCNDLLITLLSDLGTASVMSASASVRVFVPHSSLVQLGAHALAPWSVP